MNLKPTLMYISKGHKSLQAAFYTYYLSFLTFFLGHYHLYNEISIQNTLLSNITES